MANKSRASHHIVFQHREADYDRYGPQGHHVHSRSVRCLCILYRGWMFANYLRFTKDEMQRELLENMYRNNELDDLLKESDYTVRRRKECQQMVESLSRASEIVSQVQ